MAIKSKKIKLAPRDKNKIRIRKRLSGTAERPRISVFKSSKHTYAQVVSDETGTTLAAASTLEADVIAEIDKLIAASKKKDAEAAIKDTKSSKSVNAARAVGVVLARRVLEKKLTKVVFDRNGFLYSGRIKAVADGAREGGLEF